MSELKRQIIGKCSICGGSGYVGTALCECVIKFRTYNCMKRSGFNLKMADVVTSPEYRIPEIENGKTFIDYYIDNVQEVFNSGLSLYVFSQEYGRGKTTLAHYLAYFLIHHFRLTENYRRDVTFQFLQDFRLDDDLGATFLVLDDLGSVDMGVQWKKDRLFAQMHRIFQYRQSRELPTVITSNLIPARLSSLYEGTLDSLLEINADGTIGGTLFRQVEVGGGEDLRKRGGVWPV